MHGQPFSMWDATFCEVPQRGWFRRQQKRKSPGFSGNTGCGALDNTSPNEVVAER